ncbi:SDR family oxidoreductase [Alkalicoccus daliensis]|uniref:NAD(P)-dependent dehydrogenase, short-chain alcohol dehydrogenase family n=1 Tax=Alkalicoccus daliensis TaxID=745820 RepID=A0A1H0F0N0_9BACI|nr:SDR family NAD(P)-dependent oxidoreductase [Alkalicoccus daliensis]SDN88141.1 NAD(P)-dependent dehydrogenase, short-chain alcohol dehydrogenase family [Alkalicoccus daliensis]
MSGTEFSGKVILVTGGSAGIGYASVQRFMEQGARVCLFDIDEEKVEKSVGELRSRNLAENLLAVTGDVSQEEDVRGCFQKIYEQWGALDAVFANAGIGGTMAPIEKMKLEDWQNTMNVDLTGCFLTVKQAIPYLKKKGGSIVITSSVSGNRVFSQPGFGCYSTAKAGQAAFMKMAALELGQFGIRVNAVCPGGVETTMSESITSDPDVKKISMQVQFPRGHQPLMAGNAKPEQIADAVAFLFSEKAAHITGTELYIDGGESLLQG